jgi:hypothetical protein
VRRRLFHRVAFNSYLHSRLRHVRLHTGCQRAQSVPFRSGGSYGR